MSVTQLVRKPVQQVEVSTATDTWTTVFPADIKTEQKSLLFVKKLVAVGISTVTYLRGVFPETAYGDQCCEGVKLKMLLLDGGSSTGTDRLIQWISGAFDAIQHKYLQQLTLAFTDSQSPDSNALEAYTFRFGYSADGSASVDTFKSGGSRVGPAFRSNKDVRPPTLKMLRRIILLTHSLDELPGDVFLSMRLLYYEDVTPADYEPPGFCSTDNGAYSFADKPTVITVGVVDTGFHSVKLKVQVSRSQLEDEEVLHYEQNTAECSQDSTQATSQEECDGAVAGTAAATGAATNAAHDSTNTADHNNNSTKASRSAESPVTAQNNVPPSSPSSIRRYTQSRRYHSGHCTLWSSPAMVSTVDVAGPSKAASQDQQVPNTSPVFSSASDCLMSQSLLTGQTAPQHDHLPLDVDPAATLANSDNDQLPLDVDPAATLANSDNDQLPLDSDRSLSNLSVQFLSQEKLDLSVQELSQKKVDPWDLDYCPTEEALLPLHDDSDTPLLSLHTTANNNTDCINNAGVSLDKHDDSTLLTAAIDVNNIDNNNTDMMDGIVTSVNAIDSTSPPIAVDTTTAPVLGRPSEGAPSAARNITPVTTPYLHLPTSICSSLSSQCSMRSVSVALAPSRPTPDYPVRCPCGVAVDDGLMILCDVCGYWQHGACFSILAESEAPARHLCELCADPPSLCTDSRLCFLSPGQLSTSCLLRRCLTVLRDLPSVTSAALALRVGVNIAQATAVVDQLRQLAVLHPTRYSRLRRQQAGALEVDLIVLQETVIPKYFQRPDSQSQQDRVEEVLPDSMEWVVPSKRRKTSVSSCSAESQGSSARR